jgi:hypothetical protein
MALASLSTRLTPFNVLFYQSGGRNANEVFGKALKIRIVSFQCDGEASRA